MEWLAHVPPLMWFLWVFALGLMVGSFLNVVIARLPYEKSLLWPGSRCFTCYAKIGFWDNLPVVGYLRLRGRCRACGAHFSSRYLWVELGTGLALVALFYVTVVSHAFGGPDSLRPWFPIPGLGFSYHSYTTAVPPAASIAFFLYIAALVSLLIAAAVIDAEHRIIPPLIPFTGVAIGIVGGTLMPWCWPTDSGDFRVTIPATPWILPENWGKIPMGAQPWPFWGPLFTFAPAGSWQLGLLNSVIGALAGSLVVRWVKWLFETGFGKEALGLGDADLLMMAGAFLGWQPAVLSLFVGAFAALLVFKLPAMIVGAVRGSAFERELPFGPGLAVGVVATWLAWPWVGPRVQAVFFDLPTLAVVVVVVSVGMLAAGLLLRRKDDVPEPVAR